MHRNTLRAQALKALFPKFNGKIEDYIIDVQIQSLIARGIMEEGDLYIIFDPDWTQGIPSVAPYF
jgi:hypothetical protein